MSKRSKSNKPNSNQVLPVMGAPQLDPYAPVGQLHLAIDHSIERSELVAEYAPEQLVDATTPDDEGSTSDAAADRTHNVTASVTGPDNRVESADAKPADQSGPLREEIAASLGARLRAVRESKGISREEMSRRLRVSPTVIQDIESDQWARLGASVYVKGHLNSYAKALDVPTVIVANALAHVESPEPLALTVAAPVPTTWWSRHSGAATYVVLTLLLAIPVFTMVPKRGVNSPIPQVRSLGDNEAGPAVAAPAQVEKPPMSPTTALNEFIGPPESAAGGGSSSDSFTFAATPAADTTPLMASMAPIATPNVTGGLASETHRIELTFSEDCWLEIVDGTGRRIDYGMVRAGERRLHTVSGSVAMSIGNVGGVRLSVDGEAVDLKQFARLNVARLKLFESETTTQASSR